MEDYRKPIEQIFQGLKSGPHGLTEKEAQTRLRKYGANILKKKRVRSAFEIFMGQFSNFLILLLIFALLISLFTQPPSHSLVLFFIILLNVLMGFVLELKAEKSLEALKQIFTPKATVLREGRERTIEASELVIGDVVLLNQGDRVPADLRIFESSNLEIDESALTGESVPVSKNPAPLPSTLPLAERKNLAFCGTLVTSGRGKGVVLATGSDTEIGQIASSIQEAPETTPLQERLNYLGKILASISFIFVVGIFLLGFFKGMKPLELLNYSLTLLVSAVPEGLPTIVTLTLAIGVIKMANNKAIVRKLPAVETLAGVNVICVDKTGTLTKNEMTVKKVWLVQTGEIEVQGEGYLPEPKIQPKADLKQLIKAGFLCNNAALNFNQEKKRWEVVGDPTEGALLVLGHKAEIEKESQNHKRIAEILFDEKRRLMSVICQEKEKTFLYTKGAPEAVLPICQLSEEEKKRAEKEIAKLSQEGYRVLGLGFKEIKGKIHSPLDSEEIEKGLSFLGLVGLIDPLAPGVKEAMKLCQSAQIKPVIITGDHKLTALNIAHQLGLPISEENVLTGDQLEALSEEELAKSIERIALFARVSPAQKTKIVKAFQKKGYQVAMTGDGVNDAPALKIADIGIALGQRGQDIAKEAGDLILTDDRFSTIEKAVEYARTIYDNIQKFTSYLLAGNYIEISLVSLAFLFNLPAPLTPLQILWLNLITEGGPALALAVEKPEPKIMEEPPKNPQKTTLLPLLVAAVLLASLGILSSGILFLRYLGVDETLARSTVFAFIALYELTIILSFRQKEPFWQGGVFSNRWMIAAVLSSLFLQLLALYSPLSRPLGATALPFSHWLILLCISLGVFLILETSKLFKNKKWL